MSQSISTPKFLPHWLAQTGNQILVIVALLILVFVAISVTSQSPGQHMCQLFEEYEATSGENHRILLALGSAGLLDYEITDGQICVSPKDKAKYLVAIKDENALPTIFQVEEEVQPNPFLPRSQQALLEKQRKKRQVRDMILRLPFVSEVWFEMDGAKSASPFEPDQQSAVVMVRANKPFALSRQQIATIRGIVSGAVANINAEQIVVTDANVGISYDQRSPKQNELIELVSWQMARRQFYMQQLQQLLQEYPGLEINVDVVKRNTEKLNADSENKIASEIPAKLAKQSGSNGLRLTTPQITLNIAGSVAGMDSADMPFSANSMHSVRQDPEIGTVTYLKPIKDNATADNNPGGHTFAEIVKIQIRVPQSVVAQYRIDEPSDHDSSSQKFEEFKREITAKVRSKIPVSVLAGTMPISVVLIQPTGANGITPTQNKFAERFQQYWPMLAVAMLGLAAIFLNRSQPKRVAALPVVNESTDGADDQRLQNQLTTLIDNNPVAAAKVIKNWIRDSN